MIHAWHCPLPSSFLSYYESTWATGKGGTGKWKRKMEMETKMETEMETEMEKDVENGKGHQSDYSYEAG